jgi:tripartite-type tricarboxylate transporter receptor subunit TctC
MCSNGQRLAITTIGAASVVFLAAIAGIGPAAAQAYPARPVTLVVPFPAGGAGDTIARTIAERMRLSLGQPVVIENVTGASGSLGTGRVARAAPDGYTLGYGGMQTHVINGAALALRYDVEQDFRPIALMTDAPLVVVAKKAIPANDLGGLIAWLKANPDKASMATGGLAATSHLAGTLFQRQTGTRFGLVPYRGSAMQDLMAGQIDLMMDPALTALPPVRAGAVRGFAITAPHRLATAPEIPTVDEAGAPGLHVSNWTALLAPRGTSDPVIAKLNAAVVEALADASVRKRIAALGPELFPRAKQTPEALAAFHKAEMERWWPLIKAAGIKLD